MSPNNSRWGHPPSHLCLTEEEWEPREAKLPARGHEVTQPGRGGTGAWAPAARPGPARKALELASWASLLSLRKLRGPIPRARYTGPHTLGTPMPRAESAGSLLGPGPCFGAADGPSPGGQGQPPKAARGQAGPWRPGRARPAHPGQEPATSPAGPWGPLTILDRPVGPERPSPSVCAAGLPGPWMPGPAGLAAWPAPERERGRRGQRPRGTHSGCVLCTTPSTSAHGKQRAPRPCASPGGHVPGLPCGRQP